MAKEGLVAFFDILGYQDIINNNLIDNVSKIIANILVKLPEHTKDKMATLIKDVSLRERAVKDLKKIRSRLISDSILIVSEIDSSISNSDKEDKFVDFFVFIGILIRFAFDKGLPLRGVVDYGEFYLDDHCFAGKPIINCYRLSEKLQFSGTVLTTECNDILNKISPSRETEDFFKLFFYPYLVPLKDNKEERLMVLNWIYPIEKGDTIPSDVRQYIVNAFHSHKKDISQKVLLKLENTEIMLRYFLNEMGKG